MKNIRLERLHNISPKDLGEYILRTQQCHVFGIGGTGKRVLVCRELLAFTNWLVVAPKILHCHLYEELAVKPITYQKFTKNNLKEINHLFMYHERIFENERSRRSRQLELLKSISNMRIVLI